MQYRKAAKALLILIPLLGITYLVVLTGPTEGVGKDIFAIIRALLISTQVNCGFFTHPHTTEFLLKKKKMKIFFCYFFFFRDFLCQCFIAF